MEKPEKLRIIHLEDDPLDAELVEAVLAEDGLDCEVVRVQTRREFEVALEDGFDLVLADYSLPTFDGLLALEIARKSDPELPFILVSGAIGEEAAIEALKNGATDYVLKHRLRRLAPAVRRAVREAGERRERKEAEEELRLRGTAIASSSNGILITDATLPGNPIIYANPAFETITGYTVSEALGRNCRFLQGNDRDQPELEELREAIREERECRVTVRNYRKDGTLFYNHLSISPVRDEEGRLTRFIGIQDDVTERKEAEEALRKVREAERSRIARDLHDVVLQDLTYAMQTLRDPREGAGHSEVLAALRRSVWGLRAAVYDLHLETAGGSFARSLESLVRLNRKMIPDCEVELEVAEDLPAELSEETGRELLRIVGEALANVRRHSGARHASVSVGTSGDEGLWAEVSDDGRGFVPEEGSSGLGTQGMRERARAIGGDLTVSSLTGRGTVVRFEKGLGKNGAGDTDPERGGRGLRETPTAEVPAREALVLLVDDHASFRQGVASALNGEPGFVVVGQAGSLAEAREVLAAGPVDVAVVDLGLPDGYGGDLIKNLRAANRHSMALVLSSSLDRAEIARAVESGAAGVLHKSAGMDEVVDAVRRLNAGETLMPLEEVVELLRFAGSLRDEEREARAAIAQLTPRETEVLRALAEGLDGEEIAGRLHISMQTQRNHVARILGKLGVHSRLQALVFALRHGVVQVERQNGRR